VFILSNDCAVKGLITCKTTGAFCHLQKLMQPTSWCMLLMLSVSMRSISLCLLGRRFLWSKRAYDHLVLTHFYPLSAVFQLAVSRHHLSSPVNGLQCARN